MNPTKRGQARHLVLGSLVQRGPAARTLRRRPARRVRISVLCCTTVRPHRGWNPIDRASNEPRVVHRLVRHGCWIIAPPERIEPERMVSGLSRNGWEGVVWWRDPNDPDCDKAKLKGRDFP